MLSALAFLNKHEKTRDQLQFVLNEAIKPDVRNPAFIYWRLLSTEGDIANQVVKFDKAAVVHSGVKFDEGVLNELIRNMGSVSGVLHIVPSDFVHRTFYETQQDNDDDDIEERHWRPAKVPKDSDIINIFVDKVPQGSHLLLTLTQSA